MKHPDDQWLGRQCKEKKYMKLFCLYIMTQVQGNLLPINYVRAHNIINLDEKKWINTSKFHNLNNYNKYFNNIFIYIMTCINIFFLRTVK